MENKSVYGRKVNSRPKVDTFGERIEPEYKSVRHDNHFVSLAERVADSDYFTCNWNYAQGHKYFPDEPKMRCVDRYFPYAKGGALLIDVCTETDGEQRIKDCERKAKALKELGYRYIYLIPKMGFNEAMDTLHRITK